MQRGGNIIGSGGFGCIFSPPLQCGKVIKQDTDNGNGNGKEKKSRRLRGKTISKLMTLKHAISEYDLIQEFKAILRHIPNYQHYFIMDGFSVCIPDPLNGKDLDNFSECRALTKLGMTRDTINSELGKLGSLNMPHGGINIEDWLSKLHSVTDFFNKFPRLNTKLLQLFKKAILPMNKLGVFHCDIKDTNILISGREKSNHDSSRHYDVKLIDWGLSVIYHVDAKSTDEHYKIPRALYRRPFQYNVPFSCSLFNTTLTTAYAKFLREFPNPELYRVREFVLQYIPHWIKERGMGHYASIVEIMGELFGTSGEFIDKSLLYNGKEHDGAFEFNMSTEDEIETHNGKDNDNKQNSLDDDRKAWQSNVYRNYFIVEYLSTVLHTYSKGTELDLIDYFNHVYIFNLDRWGFIMTYIVFYEFLMRAKDTIHDANVKKKCGLFMHEIRTIFATYLFNTENACSIIPSKLIIRSIAKLNGICTMRGHHIRYRASSSEIGNFFSVDKEGNGKHVYSSFRFTQKKI